MLLVLSYRLQVFMPFVVFISEVVFRMCSTCFRFEVAHVQKKWGGLSFKDLDKFGRVLMRGGSGTNGILKIDAGNSC
jgi:hypothetical protein